MKFTVALLQIAPFADDEERNLQKGLICCRQAKSMAADLAVFPELWTASAIREFPEPAAQLVLNGAEIIVVPNACQWDEIRTAGLKTRAFENLVGVAMANYPAPRIA